MNSLPNKLTGNGTWGFGTMAIAALAFGALALTFPPLRRMIIKTALSKAVDVGARTAEDLSIESDLTS